MKVKRLTAALLAATIALSSFTVNGFTESPWNEANTFVADASEPTTDDASTELVNIAITGPGKTVVDNGLVRTNIINPWGADDDLIIADGKSFKNAKEVTVKFRVSDYTSAFSAWLSLAGSDWSVQYWGEGDSGNANTTCTAVDVTGNGEYEVTAAFDYAIDSMEFIALFTNFPADDDSNIPTLAIESISAVIDLSAPPEPTPGDSSGVVPEPGEDESDYTYSVLDDGTIEITGYSGNGGNVAIPAEIDGKSVTRIGESAFSFCSNLTSIELPDSVTSIGSEAFNYCENLINVTLSDSLISIGNDAFFNCKSLSGVKIPGSVTSIGSEAFKYCEKLTDVVIPDSVTSLSDSIFDGCTNLTSVKLPNGLKYIGGFIFYGCINLINVTIPDGVTSIGEGAFEGCGSLKSITIPDGVTFIGPSAFSNCDSFTSITIPSSVACIESDAFSACTALKSIVVADGNENYISIDGVLCDKYNSTLICYPAGKSNDSYSISDSVTAIGANAFEGCSNIINVIIHKNVTNIGYDAFFNCASLKTVAIPANVSYIGDYAFGYYYGYDADTDMYESKKVNGFKIYCYGGTAGEQYAKDNDFEYEILECKVHEFGEWTITEEASCIKDGEKVRICSVCNKTETETIPATGHTEVIDKAVEATCTKTGLTEGIHCSVCDAIIKAQEVVPAKGHIEAIDKAVEATCTKTGLTDGIHCSVCDAVIKAQEVVPAKGHTEVVDEVVEATCTKTGLTEGIHCSVCDAIIKAQEIVPAKGHIEAIDKAVEATCTKTGLTEGKHCSVCDTVIKAQETVPAKGHKYVDTVVKPTYTANGYTLHKCLGCGESYNDNYTDELTLAMVAGVKLGGRAADALRVNWNKNANADGYIVEIYQGGKWARVAKITSNATTTYRASGLKASTVYKFRVRAYKMEGKTAVYSAYSAELAARTNPSVIKGAKLTGRAADALCIDWSKNASADGYIVEMYQGNKWVRVAKITNSNTTTFRKAGLKAGTAYKFRVKAYKMSGKTALYGAYSTTVAARTNPSVIKGVKLTGRAADALRINWTKNTSADGYIVEMYQNGKWVRAAKITKNSTTTYRASGLKASTAYKFRVKAYKMSGKTALYGNYSATVTARTNPSVMTGVKIGGKAKDALRVNWTKNASAQGYIVEMYKGGKWVRVAKIANGNTTTFRKAGLAKNTTYKFRVKAYYMSGKTALYGNYGSVSGKTLAK